MKFIHRLVFPLRQINVDIQNNILIWWFGDNVLPEDELFFFNIEKVVASSSEWSFIHLV